MADDRDADELTPSASSRFASVHPRVDRFGFCAASRFHHAVPAGARLRALRRCSSASAPGGATVDSPPSRPSHELSPLVEQPVERVEPEGPEQGRGMDGSRRRLDCVCGCEAAHRRRIVDSLLHAERPFARTRRAHGMDAGLQLQVARRRAHPVARRNRRRRRFRGDRSVRRVREDFIPLSHCRYASVAPAV